MKSHKPGPWMLDELLSPLKPKAQPRLAEATDYSSMSSDELDGVWQRLVATEQRRCGGDRLLACVRVTRDHQSLVRAIREVTP